MMTTTTDGPTDIVDSGIHTNDYNDDDDVVIYYKKPFFIGHIFPYMGTIEYMDTKLTNGFSNARQTLNNMADIY